MTAGRFTGAVRALDYRDAKLLMGGYDSGSTKPSLTPDQTQRSRMCFDACVGITSGHRNPRGNY